MEKNLGPNGGAHENRKQEGEQNLSILRTVITDIVKSENNISRVLQEEVNGIDFFSSRDEIKKIVQEIKLEKIKIFELYDKLLKVIDQN